MVLTKQSLKAEFGRDYAKHYEVEAFKEHGFERRKCTKCARAFWSTGKDTCGDSACEPYSFFGKRPRADYSETWKKFASYFKKHGHEEIARYPTICRWRDDLYFTIASIVDFMRIEKGKVVFEYPHPSLVVPQMCLRFNDLPNVGVTGRHFSCFMMPGQHSFNHPKEKGAYWKDKCLDLNYGYLTGVLGVKPEDLTYVEDVWAMPDLSSFGPCIESFAGGLELVNSVFMQFTKSGEAYKELDTKVIDVGWGFERLIWYASGTPTAYDCCFGPARDELLKRSGITIDEALMAKLAPVSGEIDLEEHADIAAVRRKMAAKIGTTPEELARKVAPLEALYTVLDHSRALAFTISDGGLPSNVGGGYNLRVILRRSLAYMREHNFNFTLAEAVKMHCNYLQPLFPELLKNYETIASVLEIEEKHYREAAERSRRIVGEIVKKGGVSDKELITLYESQGVTPELIEEAARAGKVQVKLPSDFYKQLTERHTYAEEGKKVDDVGYDVGGLPETKLLCYEKTNPLECDAKILKVYKDGVALDCTCFYPEGGGQDSDRGELQLSGAGGKGAKAIEVIDVRKFKGIVIHGVGSAEGLKVGANVKCKVDAKRRMALTRHHTATHLVGAAARAVLGKHVWQAGAHKGEKYATLDITHFDKITPEQLREIERVANELVMKHIPLKKDFVERGEAEKKYGFTLYQGGGSPGKSVRVVDISGVDAQACAGTHVDNTSEVGFIKLIGEERIQDGVSRLKFAAGSAALEYIAERDAILRKASNSLRVSPDQLPNAIDRFFEEWKERGKTVDALSARLAEQEIERLKHEKADVVKSIIELDARALARAAGEIVEHKKAVVLANSNGDVVCAAKPGSGYNAAKMLEELLKKFGGKGGGRENLAMGKAEKKVQF
ncbi:MAG: alanine--tRNA ligase [Candidatus Burarchaeum sp.]|nr:alanine--tRNA ligase [Candidatus Burarchaeum sp.]MDO8339795.1 alanine--tRNA ligase [Candidatus Burarchaeum sp.]